MMRTTKCSPTYLAGFGLAVTVMSSQVVALAQPFIPPPIDPNIGTPRDRTGRIRRDDCPTVATDPTAITPDVNNLSGYTTDARPTLWVYLPYTLNISDSEAENPVVQIGHSAKLEIDDDNGERREYETIVNGDLIEPGIIALTLPDSVPGLEIGGEFRWILSVYCGDRDRQVRPLTISGWITRIEAGTTPDQQIWYDRLTEVGNALRNHPDNSEYQHQWTDLMQWVEVEGIESAPIQDCCILERTE
ncbi:MAG: DUF928 domain-containing protein [Cyanothece sp. SIO2G6]|nr:DUF928 domain-containing protein [Cyanothece sp. SIO2G6]